MQVVTSATDYTKKACNWWLVVRSSARTCLYSIDCEIRVSLVTRLIKLGQFGAFRFAQLAVFDASIDQTPEAVVQQATFVARAFSGAPDRRAFNDLLDQKPFFVDMNVCFVRRAKQVVIITHRFLVSPDEHERQIIRLVRIQRVQFEHLLHVVQIDELVNNPIRVARDITERRVLRRRLIQTMNRHDRKQLVQRPMVRHGAKHRKVRQVFSAEQPAQFTKLFGDIFRSLRVLISAFTNVPEQHFALRAIFERDQAEVEQYEEFFTMFKRVVVILAIVLDADRLTQITEFDHDLRIVFVDLDRRNVFDDGFNLIVTNLFDCIDNVVRKLLRRVVRRRIKRRLRTVVIDGHAAANVEQLDRHLHLVNLRVNARGFLHRILDALDVRELRTDVEVKQLQHVQPARFFDAPNDFQQLGGGHTNLRRFTARLFPTSRAF